MESSILFDFAAGHRSQDVTRPVTDTNHRSFRGVFSKAGRAAPQLPSEDADVLRPDPDPKAVRTKHDGFPWISMMHILWTLGDLYCFPMRVMNLS